MKEDKINNCKCGGVAELDYTDVTEIYGDEWQTIEMRVRITQLANSLAEEKNNLKKELSTSTMSENLRQKKINELLAQHNQQKIILVDNMRHRQITIHCRTAPDAVCPWNG